jgi:hypothetical protein
MQQPSILEIANCDGQEEASFNPYSDSSST